MKGIAAEAETSALDLLLEKVCRDGGYDFRDYRHGMIARRLERRLHATGARTYRDYMQLLDTCPEEYQRLAEDLTIKVSGFFRSPYSFQQVAGLVLPELLSHKESKGEREIRLWSTACARGEEPYSIAILLSEFLKRWARPFSVSIEATDISQQALRQALAGLYSPEDLECLSPAIRQAHFVQQDQRYEVRSSIRQMVRFSCFDLTSTIQELPTNMDCIFCCNVLIYLQKPLQERVLNRLYESLASPGYLILGEVETPPAGLDRKLECLDSKAKIYRKVAQGEVQ